MKYEKELMVGSEQFQTTLEVMRTHLIKIHGLQQAINPLPQMLNVAEGKTQQM
jgi:hypothetical protein